MVSTWISSSIVPKNEIVVLFDGYSTQFDEEVMDANCSCVLIKSHEGNIIIDTMTAWDRDAILDALASNGLTPERINYVVCTHGHADHVGNNNLFLEAKEHIVGLCTHHNTLFRERQIDKYDYKLAEGIRVIATPGHTPDDVTVIAKGMFKDKEDVTVAIAGDLFEKEEDIDEPSIWLDHGAADLHKVQAKSRVQVANEADYIVPGHGPPFMVTQDIREKVALQLKQIQKGELY